MKNKKVVFMGTPLYSVPVLKMLIDNTNVVLVVTQPDREVGRKKIVTPCPVKECAQSFGIKVLSPSNLNDVVDEIIDLDVDIIVTCAYGQILPEKIIYAPKYDTVNVHASLLPKYRGGAPIHRAIMNGEKETGITIMYTDKGMDSGDIICKESIAIGENDTYDIVNNKMSDLGARVLFDVLPCVFDGTAPRIKQNALEKTIARVITFDDEHLSFDKTSVEVHNKIRGLSSVPGGYAICDNDRIKIFESSLNGCLVTDACPGTITRVDKDSIYVACLDREIAIKKLQIPSKKPVLVKDYLNGKKKEDLIGKVFV